MYSDGNAPLLMEEIARRRFALDKADGRHVLGVGLGPIHGRVTRAVE